MNPMRTKILGSAFAAASILTAECAPKPNIVHIMVDDLGWQDVASHRIGGKPVYETPHMDRMTREGRRFTQAYSPAPSCAPSRVAFLRGQHPVTTGVYHVSGGRIPRAWSVNSERIGPYYIYGLPDSEPTIAEVLGKAGYVSGHVGKWHAGGKSAGYPFPLDQGFDFGFTERNGRHKYYNDPRLWRDEDRKRNNFFGSWGRMKPDRLSNFATEDPDDPYQINGEGRPFDKPLDLALGFMNQNKDRPFFLNYCPYFVHGPIQTRNRGRFEHYLKKMGHDFPEDPGPIYNDLPGQRNPYYASMVDEVDWMIGQVIDFLERTDDPRNPAHKLIENTYVVVDSDNGGVRPYTDNAPLKGGKQNTWEGGIRIPFIVIGPGVPAGTTDDTPINLIDLFPTFMTMGGLKPEPSLKLEGADILPQIHGRVGQPLLADGSARESLFWYFPWDAHMSSAIRKGEWKLVRAYTTGMNFNPARDSKLFRLYDESSKPIDLSEAKDVGDQHPGVRDALARELDDMIREAGGRQPYLNATHKSVPQNLVEARPKVLELGQQGSRVWVTLETGGNKSKIIEAQLIYTLNPRHLDTVGGHREEWFATDATVGEGRVEARMPPGATHAVFTMRDQSGFLIHSEEMPTASDVGHDVPDSTLVKDGFAYKPGLQALIELGEEAASAGKDTTALLAAIDSAKAAYSKEHLSDEGHCDALRDLRAAIRNQKDTPQSSHPLINRFPTDPLF